MGKRREREEAKQKQKQRDEWVKKQQEAIRKIDEACDRCETHTNGDRIKKFMGVPMDLKIGQLDARYVKTANPILYKYTPDTPFCDFKEYNVFFDEETKRVSAVMATTVMESTGDAKACGARIINAVEQKYGRPVIVVEESKSNYTAYLEFGYDRNTHKISHRLEISVSRIDKNRNAMDVTISLANVNWTRKMEQKSVARDVDAL